MLVVVVVVGSVCRDIGIAAIEIHAKGVEAGGQGTEVLQAMSPASSETTAVARNPSLVTAFSTTVALGSTFAST